MEKNKIFALLIGKKNSTGFPGKNVMNINGLPSCEYGFQAAKKLGIENIFVSRDSLNNARIYFCQRIWHF